MIGDYFRVSFLMMRAKPVRALLSLLGVFIGVLALVVILGIHEAVRRQLESQFETSGARVIYIYPGFDPVNKRIGRLGPSDLELLRATQGIRSAQTRQQGEADVRSAEKALRVKVAEVDDQFLPVYRIRFIRGRNFLADESDRKAPVAVLTDSGVRKLFALQEPVGAQIDFNGALLRIIGVVEWDGAASARSSVSEADVFVPRGWLGDKSGGNDMIGTIEVRVDPAIQTQQAVKLVKDVISRGHPEREPLYFVRSLAEAAERSRAMNNRVMLALLGIAAISLLVGGIGIANVMVTSVTERTREIGIRKALGARRIDILLQFLIEAIVLTGAGGMLAVVAGGLTIAVLPVIFGDKMPVALSPIPMFSCAAMAMVIGLVAGLYPASRAAALSPADALRYE